MGLVVVMLMAASMYAYAEWAVSDKTTQERLSDANKILGDKRDGTLSKSLLYLRNVDRGDFSKTGEAQKRYEDPALKFDKQDQDKPSSVNMDIDRLCPKQRLPEAPAVPGTTQVPVPTGRTLFDDSHTLCKEIVETEKAKFKYNLMMSELAAKRYERYWQIADERNNLDADDAGKLQSNTNKMTALMTLIGIDAAQQKAYNDVYDARIAYLVKSRDALASRVLAGGSAGGSGSLGEWGRGVGTQAAMVRVMHEAFNSSALRAERTEEVRGIE